jgi:hypothetical protein
MSFTFENMHELKNLLSERSLEVMLEYQTKPCTGSPIMDLCLGYMLFSVEQIQLFRDMFLSKQELSQA